STFILIAIAMIYGLTGTLNMADISSGIASSPLFMIILGLLIGGFGLKAAMFPFHAWKPDAIEGTPAPVGAIFAASSSAIGIYCIMRVLFIFDMISFNWILVTFGIVTMIIGALLALVQKNIKRLLAYSSISQGGYILTAFAIGSSAGITAGTYQMLNNILIELLIFMTFGAVMHAYKEEEIGKISVKNDFLLLSALIGVLALTGIPLTSGFISKWMIYMAVWYANPLITIIALAVSGLTLAYSLKLFSSVFLGPNKKRLDVHLSMKIPILTLSIIVIILGIFPQVAIPTIENVTRSLTTLPTYIIHIMG
ncbi:MAG: hypothetical protein GXO64_04030, partial [Candidatus Micrarchaeota archaeon]|nr:hypothetical protein [Candidatus Micrarchaeota archaeon]